MQALTVASNSLAVAKELWLLRRVPCLGQDEAFEVQQSSKLVAVWVGDASKSRKCHKSQVYNRTLCDVRVAVRNPEGERSAAVEISRAGLGNRHGAQCISMKMACKCLKIVSELVRHLLKASRI